MPEYTEAEKAQIAHNEAKDAELAARAEKYRDLLNKLKVAVGFEPSEPSVYDHKAFEIDYMAMGMTKTSCLIKRPMQMMEGGGIPGFYSYYDWKKRIEIVVAPNKAKRKAYLLLFPEAEAID